MSLVKFVGKLLVAVLPVLLLSPAVQAKCYTHGFGVWPKSGATVQANSLFLVEGLSESQKVVKGLEDSYQAYLQAGTERVPLRVQERLVGQYQLTQALLKPVGRLKVGQEYELVIVSGPKSTENLLFHYNGWKRVVYTVVAEQDLTAPIWVAPPKEQAKHYQEFGCGPEVFVYFTTAIREQSPYLLKATVTNLADGQATSYYLQPDASGRVALGHGMCTGAFELEKSKHFTVAFVLLDAAGNKLPWSIRPIQFSRPEAPAHN